jgi:hypothetical protein
MHCPAHLKDNLLPSDNFITLLYAVSRLHDLLHEFFSCVRLLPVVYVLHIPQQKAIKGYEVQGHQSPGLWTKVSETNKGVVFARSGSKPEAGSYNSYHEESRNMKRAHNNVHNQAYVDIEFFKSN